jgi:energy-coupling factor transporter transmembrane protein EcfT
MESTSSRYKVIARISWIAPLLVFAMLVVVVSLPITMHLRFPMLVNGLGTTLWFGGPVLALVGFVAGVLALVGLRKVGGRRWSVIVGTVGSSLILLVAVAGVVAMAFLDKKQTIPLESEEGQALLQGYEAPDYLPLKNNWVKPQPYQSEVASAVIVMNSLQPGGDYTQSDLFVPETAHIITYDEVVHGRKYGLGTVKLFTLDKLADMIRTLSGLETELYRAGSGASEYDYAAFVEHLKKNAESPDDYMIVRFSQAYLDGVEPVGGNASPVGAYNEEEDMVLMLYPHGEFWISSSEIYGAMNYVDKADDKRQGWLAVRRQS